MVSAPPMIRSATQHVPAMPPAGLSGPGLHSPLQPLAVEQREDRIRTALGVRDGGSLPPVKPATLSTYYEYLRARLSIPFEAEYCAAHDRTVREVTVVGLLSPRKPGADVGRGLRCLARTRDSIVSLPLVDLEVAQDDADFQLIEDYWYWAWNWGIGRSGVPPRR